jgi:hypothetical protein
MERHEAAGPQVCRKIVQSRMRSKQDALKDELLEESLNTSIRVGE